MVYRLLQMESIPQGEIDKTLSCMDPLRQEQVQRITHSDVWHATVCGEWLCKQMLSEQSGQRFEDIHLWRDENGKPQVKDLPLYFNISHSAGWVACAVSDSPIGIDLEVIQNRDLSVARRICSQEELDYIFAENKESLRRFLQVWTAKEAYVKLTGIGIKAMKEADFFALREHLFSLEKDDCILSIIEATESHLK